MRRCWERKSLCWFLQRSRVYIVAISRWWTSTSMHEVYSFNLECTCGREKRRPNDKLCKADWFLRPGNIIRYWLSPKFYFCSYLYESCETIIILVLLSSDLIVFVDHLNHSQNAENIKTILEFDKENQATTWFHHHGTDRSLFFFF